MHIMHFNYSCLEFKLEKCPNKRIWGLLMNSIGIIGSGVSSLHLGIRLANADVPSVIYAKQTPEQIENGKMQNSVAHMNDTILREREMGIEFWNSSNCRVVHYRNYNVLLPNGELEHSQGFLLARRKYD